MNSPIVPYQALALQVRTISVAHLPDPEVVRARMLENVARIGTAIAASRAFIQQFHGTDLRLVVLPEYALTGAPGRQPARHWREMAALHLRGPEYAALGGIAAANDLYLAGNAYEADPNFPDLYFQCSFILSPAGEVALRYRRLVSLYSPSPYDVWDRYLEIYGLEGVFPVLDTPLGRLAAVASEEILYPEIARCHVMRGAEVLVHSTSEMGSPRPTAKELTRRARAAENLAYVVSANTAGVPATGLPEYSSTGMSKVIDYEGRVLAEAMPGGESMVANATLDIEAQRSRRRRTGLANTLVRLPLQAWGEAYAAARGREANLLADVREVNRDLLNELQRQTIERLARTGAI